ncbi:MAG TPA: Rrf2 family transcriptional regulator [Thermoanaerobaculia bacterium]|jgi:Rrf2 family iron-sulfur cluster assembly transcriptional regulator|nr:Rrf2 family transcriptional regulator [Thermoanaerobaculia bacterium]
MRNGPRYDAAAEGRALLYSRTCQHALRAAERLAAAQHANPGRLMVQSELAIEVGISTTSLAQIVQPLRKAGIVRARRGPFGGVALARPAAEIRVLEVVRAIDGFGLAGRCLLGFSECTDETPCPAHPVWKRARALLERQLERRSLADLAVSVAGKRARTRRLAREAAAVTPRR